MKRYNIALRGGAGNGNAYSQLLAEIDEKNIKFNVISGSSAGALYGSMIACGYSYHQAHKLLRSIPFDRIIEWQGDIEKGNGSLLSKILKAPIVGVFAKTFVSYAMIRILKKNITWENVAQAGRCKDLRVSCINDDDIAFLSGSKKIASMIDLMKAMKGKNDWMKLYKKVKPIWCTINGTFTINDNGKMIKISDDKPELWECVYSSVYNYFLNRHKLKIKLPSGKKWKFQPLDGGIADNYAVTCQGKKFISISCYGYPKKKPASFTDCWYLTNVPPEKHKLSTILNPEKVPFLDFSNKAVDREFPDPPRVSNIFK